MNNGLERERPMIFNMGINLDYESSKIKSLAIFYNNFISNKSIENIEMISPISFQFLFERYGKNEMTNTFAQIKESKEMLDF